ncbi:MAG: hypothetical protein GC158_09225 [Cyanobacteria bacterium RI_101]|nr:hypothetical protein [Cyanobacteria bacterium RI_101]
MSGCNLQLTQQMSAFCKVASPANEKGTQFAPTKPANRDYTTSAIARMLNCVQQDTKYPPTLPEISLK